MFFFRVLSSHSNDTCSFVRMEASGSKSKPTVKVKIRARLDPNLCRIDPKVQASPNVAQPSILLFEVK